MHLFIAGLVLTPASPSSGATPTGVHLAALGEDRFSVSWTGDPDDPKPGVRFTRPDTTPEWVPAQRTSTLLASPRVQHECTLGPLADGAQVQYWISDGAGHEAGPFSFKTEPLPGTPSRVVAWGDLGASERTGRSVALARQAGADLFLHAGDLSYAGGNPKTWDRFMDLIAPVARQTPYMAAPGNHEYEGTHGARNFLDRFALPGAEVYYGLNWGPASYFFLDSESRGRGAQRQLKALEQWLSETDQASDKWKILIVHKPPYSSSKHGSHRPVRKHLQPLLGRYDVDLVLAGHDHNYERTWPIWGGRVLSPKTGGAKSWTSLGTTFVVTGTAGRPPYAGGRSNFTAHQFSRYHFTQLDIAETRIEAQVVEVPSGRISDRWELTNHSETCPAVAASNSPTHRALLPSLRALRDDELGRDSAGRALVRRYYRHGPELVLRMVQHPSLRSRAGALLLEIGTAIGQDGIAWHPPSALIDKLTTWIDDLSADSSPPASATPSPESDSDGSGKVPLSNSQPSPAEISPGLTAELQLLRSACRTGSVGSILDALRVSPSVASADSSSP